MSYGRFNFGFHHLLGPVYGTKEGSSTGAELLFTPDGNSLLAPVGNRVNVVDLKHNATRTLACQTRGNVHHAALSPDGRVLVMVDERGACLLAAMPRGVEVGRFTFKEPVTALAFSPDSKWLLVGQGRETQVWRTPRVDRKTFAPFVKHRTFTGAFDAVLALGWSHDSQHVLLGSRDMTTRVYALRKRDGFVRGTLGGHRDVIVAVAFGWPHKTQAYTLSRDGRLCCWQWTYDETLRSEQQQQQEEEDDDVGSEGSDGEDADGQDQQSSESSVDSASADDEEALTAQLRYGRWALVSKQYFHSSGSADSTRAHLTSAAFHGPKCLLVVGFSDGVFALYSTLTWECVHTLSIGNSSIHSIAINPSGEWLAFGAAAAGQLLVWEWQSETYVFKQQAHLAGGMRRLAYSPDGRLLATAGQDGKIKLWDAATGACFVTFGDHRGPVTDVVFNPKGNAVFSASMDGTIRGFDLTRYRNFRTMASPEPVQFSCMALDPSGEIVCAGTLDDFTVYVFNVQTGALLEVLGGHQAPVSCVIFSPADPVLASCGWDGTVRLHQLYGRGRGAGGREVLRHGETGRDVVCAAYRPDGLELVVGLLDGSLHFWDPKEAIELGVVDGKKDIWAGRAATDVRRAGRQSTHFAAVAYVAGGEAVLACADGSRYVLMYGCQSRTLLKRFALSENVTVDGVLETQNSRLLTDFGPMHEVAPDQDTFVARQVALPGATAALNRDLRVSPSGEEWSTLSPEGVHVFRRDPDLVLDAPGLDIADTPEAVAKALRNGEPTRALAMAMGLESAVVPLVLRCIAPSHIALVARALPVPFVGRLVAALAALIGSDERDLHLHLLWTRHVMGAHGKVIFQDYSRFREPMLALQRALHRKAHSLALVCGQNNAMLRFLIESPASLDGLGQDDGASLADAMDLGGDDRGEVDGDALGDALPGWGSDWAGAEVSAPEEPKAQKKKRKKNPKRKVEAGEQ